MNISGIVIRGKRRGHELGYPTVNIELKDATIDSGLPAIALAKAGVFAGYALVDEKLLKSAIFVHPNKSLLEAHILDFEGDLYDKCINVRIVRKVRESAKFDSEGALKEQISEDIEQIRKILSG